MPTAPGRAPREYLEMIGFVGVGKMGGPMVRRLVAEGFDLVVYDSDIEVARSLADQQAIRVAGSLPELGMTCETVVTMLPNGEIVQRVALGDDQGEGFVRDGGITQLLIDMSSSAPWETGTLGESLMSSGVRMVDAPVSGGVARAENGHLAIFVGGSDVDVEAAWPLLNALGSSVFRVGGLGSGHATKALNNLLSAACFSATVEVTRVAEAWGLDPATFAEVINHATGRNNTTEAKLRQFVLSGTFDSGFSLSLMAKDLLTASHLVEASALSVPLSSHVIDSWVLASQEMGPNADHTEMALRLARPEARAEGTIGE